MRDPFLLTYEELARLAPKGDKDILAGISAYSPLLDDFGLTVNPLRLCHFLAQAAHETAGFRTLREYGSASYFRRRYGHRRDIGNKSASDGALYRGRGIFQLTGRNNYRRYGRLLEVDLENQPELAANPEISLRIAGAYWRQHDLNRQADRNDLRAITRRINGGFNGLRDRRRYFARARLIWQGTEEQSPVGGLLQTGDQGMRVKHLQKNLLKRGYYLVADGLFGRHTRRALMAFQKTHDLRIDGIAGPYTQAALKTAPGLVGRTTIA